MKHLAALCAAIALTLAVLLLLTAAATTAPVARLVLSAGAQEQQQRIDEAAAALSEKWHVSPQTLQAWSDGAAKTHRAALADWWQGLFSGTSDAALPAFLDGEAERALIAAVLADASFTAHNDADSLRAIARDEIAYALDEAVCRAVLPLRRSLADAALAFAAPYLPMVRLFALIAAAVLAVTAAVLCIWLNRGEAAVALLAAAEWMLVLSLPVLLVDIPGMAAALNPVAGQQAGRAMTLIGFAWYLPAAAYAVAGGILTRRKERA